MANKGIRDVEERTIMHDGKVIAIDYSVRYYNIPQRDYRQCTGRLIPLTVLDFILDDNNIVETRYQNFDGNLIKTCVYKRGE